MFLSAAEIVSIQQVQVAVEAMLQRLRPSLAILGDPRNPSGTAALMDAGQGLFIAHRDAVLNDTVQARIGQGLFQLKVLSRDSRSDLVLLSRLNPATRFSGPSLALADAEPAPGSKIIVLMAEGGIVGSFSGNRKLSINDETKQAVTSSELRFETPLRLVGGALVFNFEGKLLGTVGSTVVREGYAASVSPGQLKDVKEWVRQGQVSGFGPNRSGPAPLTVAFTPSLSLMRRALGGFLHEEDRHAQYVALGVQVADAPGGGAMVVLVVPNSPAARSGVRVNDVLLAIGDRPIAKQYDFIQALFAFRPGDKTTLRLRHDGAERQVDVVLARSKP